MFQVYWKGPYERKERMDRSPRAEWLSTDNPDVLLKIVWPPELSAPENVRPGPLTGRRLQLFGCACARMVWHLLTPDARNAVLTREKFADGRATEADVRASAFEFREGAVSFQQHARNAAAIEPRYAVGSAARSAAKALATRAAGSAPADFSRQGEWHARWNPVFAEARAYQAELVRDVFPPPEYSPALRPDWRTSTVGALAHQMDADGDYSAVPILADALQDAGCDDEVMLGRCRAASGVHCRGNWIVDLVVGRE
jgi:hypothetical protein